MFEYRTVSFMSTAQELLGLTPGGVQIRTIDFTSSIPELAEHVDGWEVVNAQVVPAGEYAYLVMFLRTTASVSND
ncbi:hypothetical protein [Curtobacterium sp. MR_MD2014]|uniref:hypothetical protein n=1 Tax=Curtobacterium sp. MR_MD2014 TaxID=1561023 RepID=UPI00052A84F9|nr:hypothetical protein [Curtobacterium sp. MR_MD2014]AIV40339.1 hypothetical protein NI26_09420 [Curtobacterium sp. MR_MD2014]